MFISQSDYLYKTWKGKDFKQPSQHEKEKINSSEVERKIKVKNLTIRLNQQEKEHLVNCFD